MTKDRTVSILGVNFIHINLRQMIDRLMEHVKNEEKKFVVTANPEIVLHTLEDETYKKNVEKADYVTADGIGVVKAAQMLGQPLPERVTGFDMFMGILEKANEQGSSVYLLGAKDEVLQKTKQNMNKQFPNVEIAGSHHGFFDWEDDAIIRDIQETKPDFIFVALGFPRQEQWIAENMPYAEKGIFVGIGGSFDVLAGEVKRAPEIWQKLNLEWFYRLSKQPTRWKRMLALPRFVGKVMYQKVKGSK
ncbi:WecB/TagA/CpsF family glycosyltransferase [Texcoconibacillus texcoconensis]|uniref:N-acetylglucosaminyldiphosphoundecaprenol N-acetyl-beta-D-mannosaminyltransferase n=1 Tax=Texcoconibacillus texcoconensis TaxID=1095777 RepID=A0A840QQZ1_9BACI|nr:WecB/TagA/CpsF family glycosyltransferase [Texcoconibacillus texcoconensis]MBB5173785.1 N-acetylglucosaminyldiphosphoundecaprenol N-acetyl-beta-D-mannosaminyltransferase [Texcoconibacillus texcoconensis]